MGSPFTGIPNVKVEQKVIQPLSEEEIQALLAVCGAGDEFGCRNRAIILLFLDKGMRYAELHGLTLGDVSWEDRRIHIRHGKGRKQRVVFIRTMTTATSSAGGARTPAYSSPKKRRRTVSSAGKSGPLAG